ncbi:RNA polymerase III RPC4-domain-containing protein [Thelephora terrestris]|uniref:RNA polymerase III RPC4-domain-containing protein n=1 Tax=Thelephora terrestris TaxID=56493 RepID=A0A9P6L1P5_9AGAM|nr:RNA polymerase III RPC4-domain-containing protein [Thelephora terrestris]
MSQPGGSGKAIPSLAKKPDQSKGSGQKLKFVPTLPPRRVKPCVHTSETRASNQKSSDASSPRETDPEPVAGPSSSQTAPTRGGTGRGRGRGSAPRPIVEMKASGPFAMGPSLVGSGRRPTARSNFTPIMPSGPSKGGALGSGLTKTTAPTLGIKKEPKSGEGVKVESDEEVYSEPDEGVEIVDINDVRKMDWMAPETLKRDPEQRKKGRPRKKDKKPLEGRMMLGEGEDMDVDEPLIDDVNLANAVNLSESEDEVEEEQIASDFFAIPDSDFDHDSHQDKIYFFQFPPTFPSFTSPSSMVTEPPVPIVDEGKGKAVDVPKKVTFAIPEGQGSGAVTPTTKPDEPTAEKIPGPPIDGIIGQLELYRSGAVKMRLANGILLDVSAATQPSFLQQAVHIDKQKKKFCVLGEVNRRFIVTPEIDALLADLSAEREQGITCLDGEGLITMDTT